MPTPPRRAGREGRGVAIGLAADGPAYGRDPRDARRRSRWLPGNAPQGRVSSASAHAGPARRTTLPMGRVSSASAQPALACRARVALGNRLAPCRQDMDSVARNHLARLRRDGEPLRGRSPKGKRRGRDACLRPGPNAQSSRPFWFSIALRSSSQNARIAVAIPRSVKRTAMPVERSTAKPSLPPLTFLMPPRDFEGKRYWRLPPFDLAARCRPA